MPRNRKDIIADIELEIELAREDGDDDLVADLEIELDEAMEG